MDGAFVSRLSPYLRWGNISVRQVWHAALAANAPWKDTVKFIKELGWREFSHHIAWHFPHLPRHNLKPNMDGFPWAENEADLTAWQQGKTGVPIVDAAMNELKQTGYMHNRARMMCGSFLVKNILTHWHHGEAWFWDRLVDACPANNTASWQWIAGCGADAAPYFRI